jgi:hypothetical protein
MLGKFLTTLCVPPSTILTLVVIVVSQFIFLFLATW